MLGGRGGARFERFGSLAVGWIGGVTRRDAEGLAFGRQGLEHLVRPLGQPDEECRRVAVGARAKIRSELRLWRRSRSDRRSWQRGWITPR